MSQAGEWEDWPLTAEVVAFFLESCKWGMDCFGVKWNAALAKWWKDDSPNEGRDTTTLYAVGYNGLPSPLVIHRGEGLWKSEVLTFKITIRGLVREPAGPPPHACPRSSVNTMLYRILISDLASSIPFKFELCAWDSVTHTSWHM